MRTSTTSWPTSTLAAEATRIRPSTGTVCRPSPTARGTPRTRQPCHSVSWDIMSCHVVSILSVALLLVGVLGSSVPCVLWHGRARHTCHADLDSYDCACHSALRPPLSLLCLSVCVVSDYESSITYSRVAQGLCRRSSTCRS